MTPTVSPHYGFMPNVVYTFFAIHTTHLCPVPSSLFQLCTDGIMNEKGVSIGETTCSAKLNVASSAEGKPLFSSDSLSRVALERCATSRCAVQTMGSLCEQWGYYGWGETLHVADSKEGFIMHFAPRGKDGRGCVWVAKRVPDDHVSFAADSFVVGKVDLSDELNYLGLHDMRDVAQSNGWWVPARDGEFSFAAAFSAGEYDHKYYSG